MGNDLGKRRIVQGWARQCGPAGPHPLRRALAAGLRVGDQTSGNQISGDQISGSAARVPAGKGRLMLCLTLSLASSFGLPANHRCWAQERRPLEPAIPSERETPQHRTRLIMKDQSYQMVLSYRVTGDVVRYRSAERNGADEDVPLALVDLPATKAWERAHEPGQPEQAPQGTVLSPELARAEAARAARTPEVAKDLRLPEEDSVLVLEAYQGTPELVPLPQQNSDLNRETAHTVLKKDINPQASPHDLLFLKEERADVQLHVADPVFFVRLETPSGSDVAEGGAAFTVDTDGQSGRETPGGGAGSSRYVIERVDVRRGQRAISSFVLRLLGSGRPQPDLVETRLEPLPGGQWERLVPERRLEFGEYVLVEVLNDRAINSSVWDFGVHPTAKENDEALRPEPKRPARLEHRSPQD